MDDAAGGVAGLLMGLVLACNAGCAITPEQAVDRAGLPRSGAGSPLREARLTQTWAGRPRDELERAWGPPSFVLNVPGFREPESIVLVWVGQDGAGSCIDAFVVLRDPAETIWTYICR